jgi:hypothetical protein
MRKKNSQAASAGKSHFLLKHAKISTPAAYTKFGILKFAWIAKLRQSSASTWGLRLKRPHKEMRLPFDTALLTDMTILFRPTLPYENLRTPAPCTAFAAYSTVWRNTQSHFQLAMTVASYAACHIYTLYRWRTAFYHYINLGNVTRW